MKTEYDNIKIEFDDGTQVKLEGNIEDFVIQNKTEYNINKFSIEFADFEDETGNILWAGLYANNVLIGTVKGKLTKNECIEYLAKFVFNKIMELKE